MKVSLPLPLHCLSDTSFLDGGTFTRGSRLTKKGKLHRRPLIVILHPSSRRSPHLQRSVRSLLHGSVLVGSIAATSDPREQCTDCDGNGVQNTIVRMSIGCDQSEAVNIGSNGVYSGFRASRQFRIFPNAVIVLFPSVRQRGNVGPCASLRLPHTIDSYRRLTLTSSTCRGDQPRIAMPSAHTAHRRCPLIGVASCLRRPNAHHEVLNLQRTPGGSYRL